ncbi:type I DNA topoisomerase [Vibrio parahaemolyticus]|uniref:type I DNA topoisomerase n=1 Tax=Vibrio parahaemolyticus TaxID=670 RepID=UPI0003FE86A8|nr:type I DNA topoisomerase [Vibrio parahaemolyticus]
MNLVIVESPGKVKKIREILGQGWDVQASVGHVRDLPERDMGVEAPDFKPQYVPTERGKEVLAKLKKSVDKANTVYLATDLDREGEAIAWHLKQALRLDNPQRIRFAEITSKAIKTALINPTAIDVKKVAAQEGRRVADRLVGYMVSPKLSLMAGRRGLSAGRVQSPAVRIVVDRERAIRAFVPTNHFGVLLGFEGWTAEWETKPFLLDGQDYILDKSLADRVANIRELHVIDCEEKQESKAPPAPFITSTMQQAASNKLRMKPKATMDVAQKLYEQGLITYMRTDNPNLSDDALMDIYQVCQAKGLPMVDSPRTWKAKGDAQEAHEAIRPTHFDVEEAGETPEQRALYRLIWQRALGCQLASSKYAVRIARLRAVDSLDGKQVDFTAKGRALIYEGWKALYDDDTASDEDKQKDLDGANNPVPRLDAGEIINANTGKVLAKKTKAPSRFTEASLIKELERLGIGRPSTYAAIMENIMGRGYVANDKAGKFLLPTDIGELVVDALVNSKFSFIEYDFTRDMESQLDLVADGRSSYRDVVSLVHGSLEREMAHMKVTAAPEHPCPDCGKPMFLRKGEKGNFFGCSGYPECSLTLPSVNGKPGKKQVREVAQVPCPKCGKELIRRKKMGLGKNKGYDFFGCSGFPTCDAKYQTVGGKPKI